MEEKENEHFLLKEINKKIDNLNNIFIQNRALELLELLGNRRKLLFNNFFSGIAKGIGIGIRSYFNNSYHNSYITKNYDIKYPNNWRIYWGYCRYSRKK